MSIETVHCSPTKVTRPEMSGPAETPSPLSKMRLGHAFMSILASKSKAESAKIGATDEGVRRLNVGGIGIAAGPDIPGAVTEPK